MTSSLPAPPILVPLDAATRIIVRLAGAVAVLGDTELRAYLTDAIEVPQTWVEETLLQSYLFVGFPRALNAMREWRRISGRPSPASDDEATVDDVDVWRRRGELTCGVVYGRFYARLRDNIRELHPALDAWMIAEGYGKVLSRPQLDLGRRELCIVAACATSRQHRQLHSHLHGARHAGVPDDAVEDGLQALGDLLAPDELADALQLWRKVRQSPAGRPTVQGTGHVR